MILSKKRITKALIRLPRCAGWSAPVLLANPRRQVFSLPGPIIKRWYLGHAVVSIDPDKLADLDLHYSQVHEGAKPGILNLTND